MRIRPCRSQSLLYIWIVLSSTSIMLPGAVWCRYAVFFEAMFALHKREEMDKTQFARRTFHFLLLCVLVSCVNGDPMRCCTQHSLGICVSTKSFGRITCITCITHSDAQQPENDMFATQTCAIRQRSNGWTSLWSLPGPESIVMLYLRSSLSSWQCHIIFIWLSPPVSVICHFYSRSPLPRRSNRVDTKRPT